MNITTQQQNDSPALAGQGERPVQYVTPLADVESTKEGYTIHAEMPGVDKSGLEITVDNGELTILGHRHPRNFRVNRSIGRYGRQISGEFTNSIRPSIRAKSPLALIKAC